MHSCRFMRAGDCRVGQFLRPSLALILALLTMPRLTWAEQNDLTIAVSIDPQAWLVRQITGDGPKILTLLRPGESHESYQPSDAQVSGIMSAAVFFRIGAPFERGPWFRTLEQSGRMRVVDLRRGIPKERFLDHDHEHHDPIGSETAHQGIDPHIWLSPPLLKLQAETVAQVLGELDPARKAEYALRLATLRNRIDDADARILERLAPYRGRVFFVYHPAWGYFAKQYHLRQMAIERDGKEPTDRELTELQKLARSENVKVIFVQPQISGRAARRMAEVIGGRVEVVDPLAANVLENLARLADLLAGSFQE